MLSITFLWLLAGLFVMYKIGIHEIMLSLGMEVTISDEEGQQPGPFLLGLLMFVVLLMWPLIWIDYLQSRE